jgi:hypothetical protein
MPISLACWIEHDLRSIALDAAMFSKTAEHGVLLACGSQV